MRGTGGRGRSLRLLTAWFAENAFARGVLPAAAACAMATSRLRIGAGVFNPFSRHPTMMAMEIGALDELSDGRAMLGIGAGIGSSVQKIGSSSDKPVRRAGYPGNSAAAAARRETPTPERRFPCGT